MYVKMKDPPGSANDLWFIVTAYIKIGGDLDTSPKCAGKTQTTRIVIRLRSNT